MRLTILLPLALTAFLLLPQARADDEAETPPPKPDAVTELWEAHAKTFDLDGDGRITWEEYQKVTSGFTLLDTDKDGAITKTDVEALGSRLTNDLHGCRTAVFLGTPGGGLRQLLAGEHDQDMDGLMRILPFLLEGHGQHGSPFGLGAGLPPGLHGMPPWMGGARGGCGQPGCRTWGGLQILPWLFSELSEDEHLPARGARPEKPLDAQHPTAKALLQLIPESVRHLAAFGLIAHQADTQGDRTITMKEWETAVKAVAKEDGSLDLTRLTESVGLHGMPFPDGDTAILRTILDTNGDGEVNLSDLEGLFGKVDKNGDGTVTHDELMSAGIGFAHGR